MDPQDKDRRLALALARVPQVDPATVDQRRAQGTVVIDVRDAQAHAAAHIDGSVNIEKDSLGQRIAALVPDRSTPILCYCNGGSRGPLAALALQELGYGDVGTVAGGMRAYAALGARGDAMESSGGNEQPANRSSGAME
jgi:rhodanese-related sulfurtransferase